MALKVYIENGSGAYAQMFFNNGWELTTDHRDADLIQLEGGADVSPHLYCEEPHPRTSCSVIGDLHTLSLYNAAQERDIPIAGICRGSQFLCVMGGGKLWQDVDGHATGRGHSLLDVASGEIIEGCSSTHHQQHRPGSNAIIIAVASPQLCTKKERMDKDKVYMTIDMDVLGWEDHDVEAFYYPHNNTLGFQPHPEFFTPDHDCQKYYFHMIDKYLGLRAV